MPLYPRLDLNFSITDLQVLVIFDPNNSHRVGTWRHVRHARCVGLLL